MKALIRTAAARLLQEFGSGENDALSALDFAFDKLQLALIAGAGGLLAGVGRMGGPQGFFRNVAENYPRFTDTVTQLQRTAVINIAQRLHDVEAVGTNSLGLILDTGQQDPDYFQPADVRRMLNAADKSDKELKRTVESLLKNGSDFRQKYEALNGQ